MNRVEAEKREEEIIAEMDKNTKAARTAKKGSTKWNKYYNNVLRLNDELHNLQDEYDLVDYD